jgi:predicted MPP superfamily phosphohydrolase
MARLLTIVFFLGLLSLLAGYASVSLSNDSLLLGIGWFALIWPLLALFAALPFHAVRWAGERCWPNIDHGRRFVLRRAASLAAASVAAPMALRSIARAGDSPIERRVPVSVAGRHPDLDGLRIAHISDLHVDRWFPPERIVDLVTQVNRLRPHIIALTGDVADDRVEVIRSTVAPLAKLAAPLGRYFVTGNHEYRPAAGGAASWVEEMKRLGFVVLVNDHRIISVGKARVAVAGVCDHDAAATIPDHAPRVDAAVRGTVKADYRILLAHQPKAVFEAAAAMIDLQLSGHTHGGQCFPGHLLVRLTQPFVAGLHRWRRCLVYVTSGVGTWAAPVRLGASAEIALLLFHSSRAQRA